MGRETFVAGKSNGVEPKLAGHLFATHMDMPRLGAIEAVEVTPIGARNSMYLRH
jgi:hypothetical protein